MKYFTVTSNSVRKRSVLYDHDTESRDRAESFWLGGGGGIKMTKMLFLFFFTKKGKGPKDPQPLPLRGLWRGSEYRVLLFSQQCRIR